MALSEVTEHACAARVVVVAPTVLHRMGLSQALAALPGIEVILSAATAPEVVAAIEGESRDVAVVVDLCDGPDGLGTVRHIADHAPEACLVGLLTSPHDHVALAALEAGARAVVGPDGQVADLEEAIGTARRGELHCSPRVAGILVKRLRSLTRDQRDDQCQRLTGRELEIMGLIDEGMTNRQVARHLCIELSTVKNHLHNVFEKLDVHDRASAVAGLRLDGVLPRSGSAATSPRV